MIQHYLAGWKKFAQFSERSRRSEYWWFSVINTVIYSVLLALSVIAAPWFLFVAMGFIFTWFIPSIAVTVRRMHDVGKSGWFMLIPIYNFILTLLDSEAGTNKYGPNPKTGALDKSDHLIS